MLLLEEYHTLRAYVTTWNSIWFWNLRYIFIYFFILFNKHFGSITTRVGFDFHWKNPPAQSFYNRSVMRSVSHWRLFLRNRIKVTHEAASKREQLACPQSTRRVWAKQLRAGWFPCGFSLPASHKLLVRLFPLGTKRLLHRVAKKYCFTLDFIYFCSRALYAFVFFYCY